MPQFMTTQWTPQLDTTGKVIGFRASARGYDAKPGAAVEMSDRTYRVMGNGMIRRADTKPSGGKKARVRQRRQAAATRGVQGKLSKRQRAAVQSAQEIERRSGIGD